MTRRSVGWLLCIVLLCAPTIARAQATVITPDDLRRRLQVFAADSMLGRETGTRGHVKATEYLVRELTRMGIKPGEKNTYYQDVPIERVVVDIEHASLAVGGGVFLKPGVDFLPIVGHFGVTFAPDIPVTEKGVLEMRGSLSDLVDAELSARLRPDTLASTVDSLLQKFVVLLRPPLRDDGKADYQLWGVTPRVERYRGAVALIVESLDLTPHAVRAELASPGYMLAPEKPPMPPKGKRPVPRIPPVIAVSRSAANALRVTPSSMTAVQFRAELTAISTPTRNVVAMIEGHDPLLKSEVVVLSAHADHLGIAKAELREGTDSIMNGANGGGSGAVALLEVARHIASLPDKPKRTVVFLWTVGEEQGMLGSRWFAAHIDTLWMGKIVANINVDAIGRGGAADVEHGGYDYVQVIGAVPLADDFARWVDKFTRDPQFGLRPDDEYDVTQPHRRASCTGDHWSFARAGIPSLFITTGDHANARSVADAPATVDYDKLARVTRLVSALTVGVANRDARPALADTVMGPLTPCGQ